jgi:hypothetical protein
MWEEIVVSVEPTLVRVWRNGGSTQVSIGITNSRHGYLPNTSGTDDCRDKSFGSFKLQVSVVTVLKLHQKHGFPRP